MEGREWIFENGMWSERQKEEAVKLIKKSSRRELNENIAKVFESFFKQI
jgi:hypothetical protein